MRTLSMTISFLFVIASVTTVLFVTSPPGTPGIPGMVRGYLETANNIVRFPPITPFHTLIVTLINLFSPVLIKFAVQLEQWDSPEIEIRQTLVRAICLKLANLVRVSET